MLLTVNPLLSPPPPPGAYFFLSPFVEEAGGDLFERLIERGKKDSAELVQNIFLKWLLGVNKYCNNNADRAETGRFPIRIEAQCRIFEFCLTLTKNENKLSEIAYNDIKWNENKPEQKSQKLIGTDRIGRTLDESILCRYRNRKHDQATT